MHLNNRESSGKGLLPNVQEWGFVEEFTEFYIKGTDIGLLPFITKRQTLHFPSGSYNNEVRWFISFKLVVFLTVL